MRELFTNDPLLNSDIHVQGDYRVNLSFELTNFFSLDNTLNNVIAMHNGCPIYWCTYPKKAEVSLNSNMLNWGNVTPDNPIGIFDAVVSGLRPVGHSIVILEDMMIMSDDAKDANIIFSTYSIDPLPNDQEVFHIGFANKGRISDHFNIDNLLTTYQSFSRAVGYNLLSEEDENWIKLRAECELSEFITPDIYLLEKENNRGLVLLDLLLGHPLESTVAKITGGFFKMMPSQDSTSSSLPHWGRDDLSFTYVDPSRFSWI